VEERDRLLKFIENEEQNLETESQIDKQLSLPNAFEQLQASQFPLFTTVTRLLLMLDGCLAYSFFKRDINDNVIGFDSNFGWHNDQQGSYIIN
jgi:hypothetical protein